MGMRPSIICARPYTRASTKKARSTSGSCRRSTGFAAAVRVQRLAGASSAVTCWWDARSSRTSMHIEAATTAHAADRRKLALQASWKMRIDIKPPTIMPAQKSVSDHAKTTLPSSWVSHKLRSQISKLPLRSVNATAKLSRRQAATAIKNTRFVCGIQAWRTIKPRAKNARRMKLRTNVGFGPTLSATAPPRSSSGYSSKNSRPRQVSPMTMGSKGMPA